MALTFKTAAGDNLYLENSRFASSTPTIETTITAGPYSKESWKCAFSSAAATVYSWVWQTQAGTGGGFSLGSGTTAQDHFALHWAFYMDALPADPINLLVEDAAPGVGGTGCSTATQPTFLSVMTDGKFRLTANDGSTTLQTATNALAINTWHRFLTVADFDQVANTWRHRTVKWDGQQFDLSAGILDYTATDATGAVGGTNFVPYVTNSKGAVNPAVNIYLDDLVVMWHASDADFRTKQYLQGQEAFSSANGTDVAWTTTEGGAGTGPLEASIDEPATQIDTDDDTTYNENPDGLGQPAVGWTITTLSPTLGSREVAFVVQSARVKATAAATTNIQHRVREQGNVTNIAGTYAGTSYENTQQLMATPPSGGTWTEAIINAAEMCVRRANTTSTAHGRISAIAWTVWTWSAVSLVKQNRSSMRAQLVR